MGYYQMYTGHDGDWWWRYVASNGNEISRSSEGYRNKADCRRSIEIMKASKDATVYES